MLLSLIKQNGLSEIYILLPPVKKDIESVSNNLYFYLLKKLQYFPLIKLLRKYYRSFIRLLPVKIIIGIANDNINAIEKINNLLGFTGSLKL